MKYVTLSKYSEARLRQDYINQHARFIHSSWLLLEDLDKEVEMYGRKYRICGLWDTQGYRKIILLNNLENGTYAHVDSKEVANALGFTKFRNLVTGKEITYDLAAEAKVREWLNKSKISETPVIEETDEDETIIDKEDELDEAIVLDRDNEYVDDEEETDEEELDPLVRALRPDEDDSGWIDENDEN